MTDTDQSVAVREDSPVAPAQSMMNFIASALENPNIDAAKLKALLDMQREVMADQAKVEFNQAMFRLQAKLQPMVKKGLVGLGKSGGYKFLRYEDLDAVLRPLKDEEGFNQRFTTKIREGGGAVVICTLTHRGGHAETAEISLPLDAGPGRNSLQAMGSTISYAERYLTEMIFNIVRRNADDDGKLGGTVFIGAEDIKVIRAMMVEGGVTDEGRFLEAMQHTHIENIEAGELNLVKNILAKRISDRKQKTATA